MRILISGASVAGPTLAHWLGRIPGAEVTVVERAREPRLGGYPIDVRGPAVEVVRRMGLYAELSARRVTTRYTTYVNAAGRPFARVAPEHVVSRVNPEDVELARGDLTGALHRLTRDHTEYLFGDSVTSLTDRGDRVEVTFTHAAAREFDLVIGTDGIHSRTRSLVFGPEERFIRHLGACVAVFAMPNELGLAHERVAWTVPGKVAAVEAADPDEPVRGFLAFVTDDPARAVDLDPDGRQRLVAEHFGGAGWRVPRLVEAMGEDPDAYFDTVSQIRMPTWSRGRVALVGDSCFAPAFLSGQGTSIALVGAYVLADALATAGQGGHRAALDAYERRCREFVVGNQDLALRGGHSVLPRTAAALRRRNRSLRLTPLRTRLPRLPGSGALATPTREAANAFRLPPADADLPCRAVSAPGAEVAS